jgi:hypothetical protein
VLLISRSFDEVLLINDKAVAGNLIDYCESRLSEYKSLPLIDGDIQTLVGMLVNNRKESTTYHCIEYEPYLSLYFTEDIIDQILPADTPKREKLLQMLTAKLTHIKKIKNSIQIFNKNSLVDFVRTGIVRDFPTTYTNACTPLQRLMVLKGLLSATISDKYTIRALNPANLQVSPKLSVIIRDQAFMQFALRNEARLPVKYLNITESSVCKCFLNFVTDMDNTNLVYDKFETIGFIEEAIAHLEAIMAADSLKSKQV